MAADTHPAIEAFVDRIDPDLELAQVLITRLKTGFELRHVEDRQATPDTLKEVSTQELRDFSQVTSDGAFRPLKSAPHLRSGWISHPQSDKELGEALGHLYPGAVVDWFAALADPPPVTHYESYTTRQTGMYRGTSQLKGPAVHRMIQACCHPSLCLKRRLWTCEGLEIDAPAAKSMIPCLEPCALLLEFARTANRMDKDPTLDLPMTQIEVGSLRDVIRQFLDGSVGQRKAVPREGDFRAPDNSRKLRWILEKLDAALKERP